MNTVWVAIARYAREDDIDPIIAVGETSEAAARALTEAIIATCPEGEEDASEPDDWVEENPVELPINR